ncbi:hypothetical protein pdam_00014514 [Pocillopora damicornis]|uniref:C2H2-type domain-containing protein n=1 Tax=Pocillopora damicornis TaxID=46731 RepID=A0A3M6U050_POCDA|nr:hypothetical protein pdam_00014514 [Pocillopora damicornis]
MVAKHQPMPSFSTSHFKSHLRLPSHLHSSNPCNCGKEKEINDCICEKLIPEVISSLKPVLCSVCDERFPDTVTYKAYKSVHLNAESSLVVQLQIAVILTLKI